jgi:hypothetical protein
MNSINFLELLKYILKTINSFEINLNFEEGDLVNTNIEFDEGINVIFDNDNI